MIYFIESTEDTGKIKVKIGSSKNPDSRVNELQTGNPHKLQLIKKIQCNEYKKLETLLHHTHRHSQILGEWFEFSKEELNNAIINAEKLAKNRHV